MVWKCTLRYLKTNSIGLIFYLQANTLNWYPPPTCFWTHKYYIWHSNKHFLKIQRAITPFLTDGVQFHLACIILLSIYILKPGFNEIRQSTSRIWPRTHKKHFFKIQRAITLLLTNGVQCHLACIILLSIYILIPSFSEICQSTSKIWLRRDGKTDRRKDGRTDRQRQNNIPPPMAGDNNKH